MVYWDNPRHPGESIVRHESSAAIVSLSQAVLQNDERFLHILAHEVYELAGLKDIFLDCGGRMTAVRFFELTEPLPTAKNLHWYAWEYADALIERFREVEK